MKISAEPFVKLPDGRQAMLYTLENDSGMRAEITNLGGCIVRLYVPDRDGKPGDIVTGHASPEAYWNGNTGYFGALVGRNCNRIAGAEAMISGKLYKLEKTNGENNLHSGKGGLTFRLMSAEARTTGGQPALLLSHTIEDGGDGFPGNLNISVVYTLTGDNTLMIDYRAVSDQDTVINMTNHVYFNLAGHGSGPERVYGHTLGLAAPFYTPNNSESCPTGELLSVAGTPFDFIQPKEIGRDIATDNWQLKTFGGYDNNFILSGSGYRRVAIVTEPTSGRVMELSTNLPAVQLYTANNLNGCPGKDGAIYERHSAFCLETQFVPNAVHMPWLMSPIFRAGEEYLTTTSFHFSTI